MNELDLCPQCGASQPWHIEKVHCLEARVKELEARLSQARAARDSYRIHRDQMRAYRDRLREERDALLRLGWPTHEPDAVIARALEGSEK